MESEQEKQPRQSDGLKHGGFLPVSQENRDPRPSLTLASPQAPAQGTPRSCSGQLLRQGSELRAAGLGAQGPSAFSGLWAKRDRRTLLSILPSCFLLNHLTCPGLPPNHPGCWMTSLRSEHGL